MSNSIFSQRSMRIVSLILLFSVAFAIRMYDLTDLPLDFHPTRQLLSAIKARAFYFETQPDGYSTWQLETAIQQAKLKTDAEPPIFEYIMAYTYRFTGEHVWIARIYGSLFWLIGGIFLFMLVRDLVSFEGALASTAYFLLFPYTVIASRSFQPDPLMVSMTIAFLWMFSSWMRFPTWTKAILAGLLGGVAIYIKFSTAFFVIGGALGLVLSRYTMRELFRNAQVWAMAVIGALPALGYLIYGVFIAGFLGEKFSGRFVPVVIVEPIQLSSMGNKSKHRGRRRFHHAGLVRVFLRKRQSSSYVPVRAMGRLSFIQPFLRLPCCHTRLLSLAIDPDCGDFAESAWGGVVCPFGGISLQSMDAKCSVRHPDLWHVLCGLGNPRSNERSGLSPRSRNVGIDW